MSEIVAAKPFYEEQYDTLFQPIVITNREFTRGTRLLSSTNHVEMYERKWLMRSLKQYPVTWEDVNRCQFEKITLATSPARNS